MTVTESGEVRASSLGFHSYLKESEESVECIVGEDDVIVHALWRDKQHGHTCSDSGLPSDSSTNGPFRKLSRAMLVTSFGGQIMGGKR